MSMKYITYEGPFCQDIVIFPIFRKHDEMAMLLDIKKEDILGAGFVTDQGSNPPRLNCFGESVSLKVKARSEDYELLRKIMQL